jgi:hypothetical protein
MTQPDEYSFFFLYFDESTAQQNLYRVLVR